MVDFPAPVGAVVSIEKGDDGRSTVGHTEVAGGRDPTAGPLQQAPALRWPVAAEPPEQVPTAIAAAVIDGNQFEARGPFTHQGRQEGGQPRRGIENGQHHADRHGCGVVTFRRGQNA